MSLVTKIKYLCKEQKITVAELERKTGISNGQIRKWDTSTPGIDKLQAISDYFNISVDYLLGRTNIKRLPDQDDIHTIAAHHDGEDWTEEELAEIEKFKEFVKTKRNHQE